MSFVFDTCFTWHKNINSITLTSRGPTTTICHCCKCFRISHYAFLLYIHTSKTTITIFINEITHEVITYNSSLLSSNDHTKCHFNMLQNSFCHHILFSIKMHPSKRAAAHYFPFIAFTINLQKLVGNDETQVKIAKKKPPEMYYYDIKYLVSICTSVNTLCAHRCVFAGI